MTVIVISVMVSIITIIISMITIIIIAIMFIVMSVLNIIILIVNSMINHARVIIIMTTLMIAMAIISITPTILINLLMGITGIMMIIVATIIMRIIIIIIIMRTIRSMDRIISSIMTAMSCVVERPQHQHQHCTNTVALTIIMLASMIINIIMIIGQTRGTDNLVDKVSCIVFIACCYGSV